MALESPLGVITVTLAQFVQTVFLVMIVVEVFRLFGSFKGGGEAASKAKDIFTAGANKISKGINDRRAKKKADAEKKVKELENIERSKEELGRFLGTLVIGQRKRIDTLKQGVGNLKMLLEKENRARLLEPEVLKRVKSGILLTMHTELQKIRDDMAKLLYTTRRTRFDVSSKKHIDDIENDYKEIQETLDKLLSKMIEKKKQIEDQDSKGAPNVKVWAVSVDEAISFTESFQKSISGDYSELTEVCEKFKNDDTYVEKVKDLLDMIRQGRLKSSLDSLKNALNKVYTAVIEIEESLNKDPMKRGEAFKKLETSVMDFDNDLHVFEKGESDFMNKIGTINEDVSQEEEKINHIKSLMNNIERRYSEFKRSEKVNAWFKGL